VDDVQVATLGKTVDGSNSESLMVIVTVVVWRVMVMAPLVILPGGRRCYSKHGAADKRRRRNKL